MPVMRTSYKGASAVLQRVGVDVAQICMRGPLTVPAARHFRETMEFYVQTRAIRAVVADYTAALLMFTGEELGQMLVQTRRTTPVHVPVAMVVSSAVFDDMAECTQMAARCGLLRALFTEFDEALRWAREEARLQPPRDAQAEPDCQR